MKTSLSGLLREIGEELFPETPRWIWHDSAAEMDVSVPLRRNLPLAGLEGKIAIVESRYAAEVRRIWMDGDHLNLQFHPAAIIQCLMSWSLDAQLLWSELSFPEQTELELKDSPASWGPILQGADVLAQILGWEMQVEGCQEGIRHTKLIRNLLRHAEILSIQSGDPPKRQRNAVECVVLDIKSLWSEPILDPRKPADSALRQTILKIWVAFARRAGARWGDR